MKYESYIKFGEEHTDERTGLSGYPLATTIYKFGCERTTLEWEKDGGTNSWSFDAPRVSQNPSAATYESDIVLGEKYKDTFTGIVGVVDSLTFHEFGAENPNLVYKDKAGREQDLYLDAGRLEPVSKAAKNVVINSEPREDEPRPGGPARGTSHIRNNPTRR